MSELVVEQHQQQQQTTSSAALFRAAPSISDEAMEAKRKALEILVAPPERTRIPVPNHLLQSSIEYIYLSILFLFILLFVIF